MKGKTYQLDHVKATVSSEQTFSKGSWKKFVTSKATGYTDFSIELPFTPTKLESCHIELTGDYISSNQNRLDADFRMSRRSDGAYYWFLQSIPNDFYMASTDSANNYIDTKASCSISGSRLIFRISVIISGSNDGFPTLETRSGDFYLSGVIAYD